MTANCEPRSRVLTVAEMLHGAVRVSQSMMPDCHTAAQRTDQRPPKYRVLFVNDTARNGGPGRSLETILKFVDPRLVHRGVVLPRAGAVSELLSRSGVVDELHFEPNIVENVFAPLT